MLIGVLIRPQSIARTSCQLPSDQLKTRSKTPKPGSCSASTALPRAAATRHTSRSRSRSVSTGARLGPPDRHGPATPPGTGLHPVRDHLAHLPQPSPPQELVGVLVCALAHLHRVVVAPHVLLLQLVSAAIDPCRCPGGGWGSRSPPTEALIEHVFEQPQATPPLRHDVKTGSAICGERARLGVETGGPDPPADRYVAAMSEPDTTEHPSIARFRAELAARGGTGRVVVLPDSVHTAALAAAALGCEVGAIANSLLFDGPRRRLGPAPAAADQRRPPGGHRQGRRPTSPCPRSSARSRTSSASTPVR